MRVTMTAKSRKLPCCIKEHRRQSRRAQQAAVDAERNRIIARLHGLARSFAPSQQQAFSQVNLSKGGHVWETNLCFGKGKNFDDIGRWYRFVSPKLQLVNTH